MMGLEMAVHQGLAFHHTLGREPVLAGWHVPGRGVQMYSIVQIANSKDYQRLRLA